MKVTYRKHVLILTTNLILVQVVSLCTSSWMIPTGDSAFAGRCSCSSPRRYMTEEPPSSDWMESPQDEFDAIYDHAVLQQEKDHDGVEISRCYSRDPDDDLNVADKKGLRILLSVRFEARKRRNFERVDEIDILLKREHGVRAYDNPNVWTRQSKPPASYLRRRARKKAETMKATFGPTGNPYRQVGGPIDPVTCPLTAKQLHSLFSSMQQYRMDGRFEEADATQFELMLNGVQISERSKSWRADGQKEVEDVKKESNWMPRVALTYSEHPQSNRGDSMLPSTLLRVEQLLEMHSEALARGESDLSRFIELELYRTYGVEIDDDSRSFSFGPTFVKDLDRQPPIMPVDALPRKSSSVLFPSLLYSTEIAECTRTAYRCSDNSEPILDDCVRDRIEQLVLERKNKRDERKFYEADAILKELYETYSVRVDDESREWTVDGNRD